MGLRAHERETDQPKKGGEKIDAGDRRNRARGREKVTSTRLS